MLRALLSTRTILAPVTFLLIGVSSEALPQEGPPLPPVRELLDENGVDLLTGEFNVSRIDIDIGPPEARLSFRRSSRGELWGDEQGFQSNIDLRLRFVPADQTPDGVPYAAVIVGTTTDRFTQSGSSFTSQGGMGTTLVFDTATQNYVYTQRDGTVVRFPASSSIDEWDGIRGLSIEAPDGTRTEFSNKRWPVPGYPFGEGRVQSVVNNTGYQLKFEYDGVQSTTLTKVSVLNRGAAYCDPTADTCAATAGAPSVTYSWSEVPYSPWNIQALTATDAGGRQTRWTMGATAQTLPSGGEYFAGGPTELKSAGSSTDDTSIDYALTFVWGPGNSAIVSSITRRGMTWNYELIQNVGVWPILKVTNPLGHTREVQWNMVYSQVHSDKDELGRTVTYQYDSSGRRNRITYPEGNFIQLTMTAAATSPRCVASPSRAAV